MAFEIWRLKCIQKKNILFNKVCKAHIPQKSPVRWEASTFPTAVQGERLVSDINHQPSFCHHSAVSDAAFTRLHHLLKRKRERIYFVEMNPSTAFARNDGWCTGEIWHLHEMMDKPPWNMILAANTLQHTTVGLMRLCSLMAAAANVN